MQLEHRKGKYHCKVAVVWVASSFQQIAREGADDFYAGQTRSGSGRNGAYLHNNHTAPGYILPMENIDMHGTLLYIICFSSLRKETRQKIR